MDCPYCKGAMKPHAKTKKGVQRYRCVECKRTTTGNSTGRPTIGDAPLSNSERQKKYQDSMRDLFKKDS